MLKKPILLMFSGKAGVGKTTAALTTVRLLQEAGNTILIPSIYHFAQGVKETAVNMGWDGVKDKKGRELLINIGQTGRAYDENTWAKSCLDEMVYDLGISNKSLMIIDDWRFPNELEYLKDSNIFDVFTVRIFAEDREILKGTEAYNDVSETSLSDNPDDYDFFIEPKNFEELEDDLTNILLSILTKVKKYGE